MIKIIKFISKILLIILILLSNIWKVSAEYGSSCDPLPSISNLYELEHDTWYGLVKNSIDATKESIIPEDKRCNVNPDAISICIRNMTKESTNTFPACDLLTFDIGNTNLIFNSSSFTYAAPESLLQMTLTATNYNGQLCLMMKTIKGEVPITCKGKPQLTPPVIVKNCKLSPSCYDPDENKSQAIFNFSGFTYNCVKNSLHQLFYNAETCVNQDTSDSLVDTTNLIMSVNPFASFQIALRQGVIAAITLYLMMFGMQMLTEPDEMSLDKYSRVVLNVVLVMYFSIGLGKIYFLGAVGEMFNDGMTQLVLPFLLSLSNSLTDIVFKAAGSQGLCYFDPYTYPEGYSFYALWDSIDCRITYYFAGSFITLIDSIITNVSDPYNTNNVGDIGVSQNILDEMGTSGDVIFVSQEVINQIAEFFSDTHHVFELFTILIPIILGGGFTIVISMLSFGIMFIGLSLNLLTICIVSLICLYFITYLAPLFVPMVLFEKTRGFFDVWWKLLVSFALRPVIVAGFVALTVTIVDTNFYGNCEFDLKRIYLGETLGTANIYTPTAPDFEPEKCNKSVGMKLKDMYAGKGMWTLNLIIFKLHIWTDVLNFALDMAKMAIVGYLMFYFMRNIEGLAAELSGSQISIGSMVISADAFVKKGTQAFSKGMKGVGKANAKFYKGVARKTGMTDAAEKIGSAAKSAAISSGGKVATGASYAAGKAAEGISYAGGKASDAMDSSAGMAGAAAGKAAVAAGTATAKISIGASSAVTSIAESKLGQAAGEVGAATGAKASAIASSTKATAGAAATAISESKVGQGISSAASATAAMATGAVGGAAKLAKTAANTKAVKATGAAASATAGAITNAANTAAKATANAASNQASKLANNAQSKVMNSKIAGRAQAASERMQGQAQDFLESEQGQQLAKTAKHLIGKGEQKAGDLANKASDKLSKLAQKFNEGKNKPPK